MYVITIRTETAVGYLQADRFGTVPSMTAVADLLDATHFALRQEAQEFLDPYRLANCGHRAEILEMDEAMEQHLAAIASRLGK